MTKNDAGPVLARITKKLVAKGYQKAFLRSVIPTWWTPEVEQDPGGLAHLKLILARDLGLDLAALLDKDEIEPAVPTGMEFKRAIDLQNIEPPSPNLAYYSRLVKAVASAIEPSIAIPNDAGAIRADVLRNTAEPCVSLKAILEYCWRNHIAVIHVDKLPMKKKGFDALVYPYEGRYVIVLARKIGAQSAARASFIIAHELGHIAMGHIETNVALIDDADSDDDRQKENEPAANAFAANLLAGEQYDQSWSGTAKSPQMLAKRALRYGAEMHIDPGHLLLRHGWESQSHGLGMKALNKLPAPIDVDTRDYINRIAQTHINSESLGKDVHALLSRSVIAA
jgi:hypothetical protein